MGRISGAVYLAVSDDFKAELWKKIKERGLTMQAVSRVVLNAKDTYLSGVLKHTPARIPEEYYAKLIDWAGMQEDYDKYIIDEDAVTPEIPAEQADSYKELIETGKQILAELKIINAVMQEVRTATRYTAHNTQETKSLVDEIAKEVK